MTDTVAAAVVPADDRYYAALVDDDVELLYEQAPCGYLSTDGDGLIVKVNETFEELSGFRRHELVGRRRFADLLTRGGQIYHETHLAPLLRMHGKARELALELVTATGVRLPVLVNAARALDAHGKARIVRMAVFDARERRSYERELLIERRRAEASEQRAREVARVLQQSLLPPSLPMIDGIELAGRFRPADLGDVIGGDFYDVFQIGPGAWIVALGDVCGKGIEAAVVASRCRYTIRAAAMQLRAPDAVLATLNDLLMRDESDRFCTALVTLVERVEDRWMATVASGGHPLPVVRRSGGAEFVGRGGTLLGVYPTIEAVPQTIELDDDATLLMYTDGVTEARAGREFFGEERLLELAAKADAAPDRLVDAVIDEVVEFQQMRCRDDMALVALRAQPRLSDL